MPLPIKTGSLHLFDGGLECFTVSFRQAVTMACEIILNNLAACRTLFLGLPRRFCSGDLVVHQPCIVFCNFFRCAPVGQIVAFVFVNAFRPSHVKAVTVPIVKRFGNVVIAFHKAGCGRILLRCSVSVVPSFISPKQIVTIPHGLEFCRDLLHFLYPVMHKDKGIYEDRTVFLPKGQCVRQTAISFALRKLFMSPPLSQPDIIPVRESFIVFATFPSLFQGRQSLDFGPEPNSPIIVKKPVRTIRSRSFVKRQGTRICCSPTQNKEGQNG